MSALFGREQEKAQLSQLLNSDKAEFIAVYGRRRVGKTFLIKEHLRDQITFYASGVLNEKTHTQVKAFMQALDSYGAPVPQGKSWMDMFYSLRKLLHPKAESGETCVIFIDEMPCLDTPRSGFVPALDYFWNTWASNYSNVKLIVCGSATSWMIKNLIDSHGGLHDRITSTIHLHPFTLKECEQYLNERHVLWNRNMVLQFYMVFGGIPFYLSLVNPKESLPQAVDRLYFRKDAPLSGEYSRMLASLFRSPEPYRKIIEVLSQHKHGMTRDDISDELKMKTGGNLSKLLKELEQCDFVRSFFTREKKIKRTEKVYQLTDMFCLFHIHFAKKGITDGNYWQNHLNTSDLHTWQGIAYERVAMHHIEPIKKALGIDRIGVEYYAWRSKYSTPASQIDLLLDRADGIVNLCEIKYSQGEYSIKEDEEKKLNTRQRNFISETESRQAIRLTMITSYGLKHNIHSSEVAEELTMDDLFAE